MNSRVSGIAAVAWVILLSLVSPAFAQREITVRAWVEPQRITLGEVADLFILVEGTTGAFVPEVPDVDGLSSRLYGRAMVQAPRLTIRGERQVRVNEESIRWSVRLTPQRPGVFEIPPISIEVENGRFMRTEPIRLSVVEPEELDGFVLTVEADDGDGEWFVGQSVRMRWRWTIRQASFDSISLIGRVPTDDLQMRLPSDTDWAASLSNETIPFLGQPAQVAVLNPSEAPVVVIERDVIAEAPGEIFFGPFTVLFRLAGIPGTQFVSPAEEFSVRVVPPPEAGKPASFTGFVADRVAVRTRASATEVSVGDPIELELLIEADSFGDRLQAPDLSRQAEFAAGFRVAPGGWTLLESTPRGKLWQTTIRPKRAGVSVIPAVEFSTLEAETGSYRTFLSEPISISVQAAAEITADDAIGSIGGLRSFPLEDGPGGLMANHSIDEALADRAHDPLAELPLIWWVALLVSGPVLFVCAALVAYATRPARSEQRRRARALALARKSLAAGERDASAVSLAIRRYVGDRLGLDGPALTDIECVAELSRRGVDDGTLASLRERLRACDEQVFGGEAASGVTVEQVRELLARVDDAVRRAKA